MDFIQVVRDNPAITVFEAAAVLGFGTNEQGLGKAGRAIRHAKRLMRTSIDNRATVKIAPQVSNFIHYTKYDPLAVKAYEDFLNSLPKNRRRALELSAEGSHTKEEWLDLCTRTGNICLRCRIVGLPLTVDHIVPLSKGGSHFIQNLQPLCRSCNSIKGVQQTDYRPVLTPLA